MKISITLDNRDWGIVAKALTSYLNFCRNRAGEFHHRGYIMEQISVARVRADFINQRRAAVKKVKMLSAGSSEPPH